MDTTKSLAELQAEREELKKKEAQIEAQIEAIKKSERKGVLNEIRAKVKDWGFTAEDVFPAAVPKKPGKSKSKGPAVVKYKNEKGEVWSGLRGRKPNWVIAVEKAGEDIEKYRV